MTTDQMIALCGSVAAGVAALFALVSLILIWRQIWLAKRQIGLAKEQIGLAKDELGLVRDDLNYSREQSGLVKVQMLELQKRPALEVTFDDGRSAGGLEPTTNLATFLTVAVRNVGERTSHNVHVILLFPMVLKATENHDFVQMNGEPHMRWTFNATTVWPTHQPSVFKNFFIHVARGSHTLYWRVYDDFGVHPESDYGTLSLNV